ncbi:50S ribosomal protein L5 [Candidatus Woesearchaeota archaeon]|nr:50S ribosomal protein L5 [Candidatus Woesearchaeota archaeon]MBW2978538.1 50S ribosomal protein L5 [Candidatus Woesearchaeota archaeon]
MNPMQKVRIEKLTLNIGCGKDTARLDKGIILIKTLTGIEPIKTVTSKRIPSWGLRPGLPIGVKLTLRKKPAKDILSKLLSAKDNALKISQFDSAGNISFGIQEYIDIPGIAYNPDIGIIGLEVCVTLEKPGFRIKRRRLKRKKIPRKHLVSKQEALDFMKNEFNIKIVEESA